MINVECLALTRCFAGIKAPYLVLLLLLPAPAPVCTEHVYLLHNNQPGESPGCLCSRQDESGSSTEPGDETAGSFAVSGMHTRSYTCNTVSTYIPVLAHNLRLNLTVSKARDTHLAPEKVVGSSSPDF